MNSINLLISLWITLPAWGWGEAGHRFVAEYGTRLVDSAVLANCRISADQIVSHTNDPDRIWREQRRLFPDEALAHYFHLDRQPSDWQSRKLPPDKSNGFLVYRITDWIEDAKKLREAGQWDELSTKLYGLSHYIGDLTQPLHLHHDHDGKEAGVEGLHSQFETKMIHRYENEVRSQIESRLKAEKIPPLWLQQDLKDLIFDSAQQSYSKAARLLKLAQGAVQIQKASKKRKKRSNSQNPRFVKKLLWNGTGDLATGQLAIAARLWAHSLNQICK